MHPSEPVPSPFLQVPATEWLASNDLAFAIPALDPAAPGHTLVVLWRVVASYFDATGEEKAALWALVDEVKALLDERLHPDGYDVSFSTGELAGPRVRHAHIAILPRCRELAGATPARRTQGAPRPSGAPHHDERRPPLATGGENDPLSRHLGPLFSTATDIAIVAAFVTETGLDVVRRWIFQALRAGARLRIVTGDYLAFTQVDALRQLLGWTALELEEAGEPVAPVEPTPRGQLRVRVVETALADGSERAFHPKSWLFESRDAGVAFVGSSNLSRSALETGVEWNLRVERAIDPVGYASVRQAFEALWASATASTRTGSTPTPSASARRRAACPPATPTPRCSSHRRNLTSSRRRRWPRSPGRASRGVVVRWSCSRPGSGRPGSRPSTSRVSREPPARGRACCSSPTAPSCSRRRRAPSVACSSPPRSPRTWGGVPAPS